MAAVLAAPETEILEAAREAVHTAVEQQTISIALVAGGRAVSFAETLRGHFKLRQNSFPGRRTHGDSLTLSKQASKQASTLWKISHWHLVKFWRFSVRKWAGWTPSFQGAYCLVNGDAL